MAIYSLNLGFISRSAGRSAVGFCAYISGTKQQDLRTGVGYDYSNKSSIVVSRILAPEGSPDWTKTSSSLWNAVESFEDHIACLRFRGDVHDPERHARSLSAREAFLASTQTAQTIMGAIPLELTLEEAHACVEEFLMERFVSRGLVVEYAIHGDKDNPHFHALITRRPLIVKEKGDSEKDATFSPRKDRDIVTKAALLETRKSWEVVVNKHLALAGHEVRIDSRSYEAQGLDLAPTHHEGWYAQNLAKRGECSRIVAANEAIRQKNIGTICENPGILIQDLALKRTVFTHKHLEDEIVRRVGGDEQLFSLLKAKVDGLEIPHELILRCSNDNKAWMAEGGIKSFETVLRDTARQFTNDLLTNEDKVTGVGEDLNREAVFTSQFYHKQEETIGGYGEALSGRESKSVGSDIVEKAIQARETQLGFALSDEQRSAIMHLCSGPDLRILNGKAGTGKTTLLKAVAEAYQGAGYRVLGTSFQGKAVEIMEKEIGIPSKTLDSFRYAWEKNQHHTDLIDSGKLWGRPYQYSCKVVQDLQSHLLTEKDVVIVDEANMVGNPLWEMFLKQASTKGAKVLIIQDPAQITSRGPGDTGRLFAQKFGFVETREVMRQRIPWQRECSKLLNDHHVRDGLTPYYEKGHLTWHESKEQVIQKLTKSYVEDVEAAPDKTRMALAYRNADVARLNQSIREALIEKGFLGGQQTLSGDCVLKDFEIKGERYTIGDRIRFTQNDHHGRYVQNIPSDGPSQRMGVPRVGVKNGTLGVIEAYDEATSQLTVFLEGDRKVQLNTQEYTAITHGYAMGIHKSEGSTFDRSFVMLDPLIDPSTLLVAMTRHRDDVQVCVDHDSFTDFKALVETLGRPQPKVTVHDYKITPDQKPFFERVQHYRDFVQEAGTFRTEITEDFAQQKTDSQRTAYQNLLQEKREVAGDILKDWESHAPYVKMAGIRKDVLEVEVGLRARLLSDLEHQASLNVQLYREKSQEARHLWKEITGGAANESWMLASSHPLYGPYQTAKAERDSLAYTLQETPQLYRPFLKVTKDPTTGEMRDYWGDEIISENRLSSLAIKSHATAHFKTQRQAALYERLSVQEKVDYDEVKAYVHARNSAAALYGQIKKQETATDPQKTDAFRGFQMSRDALALKLVESPEQYQQFFDVFNIKEDRLLTHAVAGELREKVTAYSQERDITCRATRAQELQRILTSASDYRIFTETTKAFENVDLNRLSFDVALYEKVKAGEIEAYPNMDALYRPLQSYFNAAKEAATTWKALQNSKASASESQDATRDAHGDLQNQWQVACHERILTAQALVQDKRAFSIIEAMGGDIHKRVTRHAGREVSQKDGETFKDRGVSQRNQESHYSSATTVLEAVKDHIPEIASQILGEPNRSLSSKTSLRFGNKGSLVINTSGPKTGLWKDFESGEGGNIFNLIQREKNIDFKEAVSYAANFLNLEPSPRKFNIKPLEPTQKPLGSVPLTETPETAKTRADKLNAVAELHMKSTSLGGTPTEIYLREVRGIQGDLEIRDLRYLPPGTSFLYQDERKTLSSPHLAAFGRSENGRLSSVQLTRLTESGEKALTSEGAKMPKLHYGIAKGSFVCVQNDSVESRVFIAEGLETALSLKEAGLKGKIVASLGIHNMANYQGLEKEVVLCGDNDDHKENSSTHALLERTQEQINGQGKLVTIIKPHTPGDDFNDVLKKRGLRGVRAYMKPYLDPEKQTHNLYGPILSPTKDKNFESLRTTPDHLRPTGGSSFTADKSDAMADITGYLQDKLNDLRTYKNTSYEKQAKEELRDYLKSLEHNDDFFRHVRVHHRDLAKDLDRFNQQEHLDKEHHHDHTMSHGRGFER